MDERLQKILELSEKVMVGDKKTEKLISQLEEGINRIFTLLEMEVPA